MPVAAPVAVPQMPLTAPVAVFTAASPQIPAPVAIAPQITRAAHIPKPKKPPMSAAAAAAARAMATFFPSPEKPSPSPSRNSVPCSPQAVLSGVEAWSVQQVCSWLLHAGFGAHLKQYREAEIDGFELVHLTAGDLRIELGIRRGSVRKDMLNQIAQLEGYESSIAKWAATVDPP